RSKGSRMRWLTMVGRERRHGPDNLSGPESERSMARILFVTWPGGGNQTPAIGMAQALQQRGHKVIFAGYDVQAERFDALGFRCLPLARSAADCRSVGSLLAHIMTDVFASADHLRDVPDVIARTRCAGLVVDCMQFGALAAAEDVGLPVAVLV